MSLKRRTFIKASGCFVATAALGGIGGSGCGDDGGGGDPDAEVEAAVQGDAGGYAVGLLGFGYAVPLNNTWTVSVEGHIGAAGGGGIDTGGGLVGAVRVELDYALKDNLAISAGVGTMQSLGGSGGARPLILHLGLKTAFTTFH